MFRSTRFKLKTQILGEFYKPLKASTVSGNPATVNRCIRPYRGTYPVEQTLLGHQNILIMLGPTSQPSKKILLIPQVPPNNINSVNVCPCHDSQLWLKHKQAHLRFKFCRKATVLISISLQSRTAKSLVHGKGLERQVMLGNN